MDPFGEMILWKDLDVAPLVREFHGTIQGDFDGRVTVTKGAGLAGWLAALFGFPPSMQDRPMRLSVRQFAGVSIWNRDFDGHGLTSLLRRDGEVLQERIGPIRLAMALYALDGNLCVDVVGATLYGVPLPRSILPQSQSIEYDDLGRLGFDISASVPGLGLLVRYHGWLKPAAA